MDQPEAIRNFGEALPKSGDQKGLEFGGVLKGATIYTKDLCSPAFSQKGEGATAPAKRRGNRERSGPERGESKKKSRRQSERGLHLQGKGATARNDVLKENLSSSGATAKGKH